MIQIIAGLVLSLQLTNAAAVFEVKKDIEVLPAANLQISKPINDCGLKETVTETVYITADSPAATEVAIKPAGKSINSPFAALAALAGGIPWFNEDGPPNTAIDLALEPDAASATYSRFPCPLSLAYSYNLKTDNSSWTIFCNTDLYFGDLLAYNGTNLAVCMQLCQKHNGLVDTKPSVYGTEKCVAVTYTAQAIGLDVNCYLKKSVSKAVYKAYGFDSAKLDAYDIPDDLVVSVYSANPTAPIPIQTAVPSGPYAAASPCPYTSKSYYKYNGSRTANVYQLSCDTTYYYNDLPGLYTANFDDCVASCDAWVPLVDPDYAIGVQQPCIGVTYQQYIPPKAGSTTTTNCHRKYAIASSAIGAKPVRIAATRVDNSVAASLVTTYFPTSTYSGGR